ncbi:MAG TPA: acyl-ACP--UDP-N-acetylglucosamine O-acyltransferase [Abditibacteriaceae bacterium]|jgi:UDP-N-acetylglucosamine acyltransferase
MADAGTQNTAHQTQSSDTSTGNGAPEVSPKNPRVQMPKVPYPPLAMPLGYEEICQILPHRYPFLLVDRIVELEPGHRCVGVKNVTANEEHFQGHFPGHPVMPGVLILEAMAQVAGVLTLVSRNTPGALSYFAAIEKARFRHPVRPGDQLITEATLNVLRGDLCKVHVVGRVDEQIVVESDYTFMTRSDNASTSVVQTQATALTTQGAAPMISASPVVAAVVPDSAQNGTAPVTQSTPRRAADSAGSVQAVAKHGDASTYHAVANAAAPALPRIEGVIPPRESTGRTFVHPTALVDPKAELEEGVWVGPYCIIEGGTRIGKGTILEAHAIIKSGTSVGERCRIWPHVILGHEPQDVKFRGQESFLKIGNDNILREMVTIHRATGEGAQTTIGNNNLLMAYVHIGHNCVVGNNTMISNSTGLSGHVTIEDKVVIGGFVGIHQFVHVGKMGMIGGLSKVVQDVPPFCTCDGRPAKVHGLNTRGLRRNGVPSEVRNQVSTAFKLLYRSGLNTSQALERIHAEVPRSETLDYFIDFVERVREGRLGRQDETPHF